MLKKFIFVLFCALIFFLSSTQTTKLYLPAEHLPSGAEFHQIFRAGY